MGSRQSSFKKGGGFLNEVDATIIDYQFTDEFNGEPYKPGKMKGTDGKTVPKPHSLNCFLSVRVDEADEDTTTTLRVAKEFTDWEVSEDGHVLTPVADAALGSSSAFGKFIQSWEAASGQGAESDEHGEGSFGYEPIIGSRVRLVQRDYSDAELARIKQLGAGVKRKGKDGKEYTRQSLVIDQVYELAAAETKPNGRSKRTKPNTKGAGTAHPAGKSTHATASSEPAETDDLKDLAGQTVIEILETLPNGKIEKVKLSMKTLLTPLLKGHPQRTDVRKWLAQDDNLAELVSDGLIGYDKSTQTITAV